VSGSGLSLVSSSGARLVVCATDDRSARIEDLQLTLGEGPCVDAMTAGVPVLVPDLGAPDGVGVDRWPAFMDAALKDGVKAVFAVPLQIGAIRIGALDLYRSAPGPLTDTGLAAALWAADTAALSLLELDVSDHGPPSGDLDPATVYNLQVHQATGMVKVQLGVTVDDAFLILRAHAFSSGRALIDVAVDVVERRLRFSPEERS
jgi:hypothetical protein